MMPQYLTILKDDVVRLKGTVLRAHRVKGSMA